MIKSNIQYNELNFNNDYDSTLLLCCNKIIINFLNTLPIKEDINKLEFYQNNNITLDFYFINKHFLDNRLNLLTIKYYNDDIDDVLCDKYNKFSKYINNVFKFIDKVECQICFNKNNLYQFYNCNHGICFFCFKNHNKYKCPFCRNKLS